MEPELETVTIVLVGDPKCGKSTFLSRVTSKDPTAPIVMLRDIDQPYVFEVKSGKSKYRLQLHDTASPDNWMLLEPDVLVICYDISTRLSLINMRRQWMPDCKIAFVNRDVLPVLILGLKRDLRSETDPNGIIMPNEGYQAAQAMRADKYMECSAKTGELVKEAFEEIVSTALHTTSDGGGQSEGGCIVM